MMTRLSVILGGMRRSPRVVLGGAILAMIGGALTPGDLVVYTGLHTFPEWGRTATGIAPARAEELFMRWTYGAASLVASLVACAAFAWIGRLLLVSASIEAARGGQGEERKILRRLSRDLGRVIRTRQISLMVTGAFAFIPLYLCAAVAGRNPESPWPLVGVAAVLALANAWTTMSDRFALARFDSRQDSIAAQKRQEGRQGEHFATASQLRQEGRQGEYYLDTSAPRQGYGVATGADNAVTDGGWSLLSGRGLAVIGLVFALDLVPALAGCVLRAYTGGSSLLLTPLGLRPLVSPLHVLLGAALVVNVVVAQSALFTWLFVHDESAQASPPAS